MTYHFRPATLGNPPLLCGIAGGTGSGKTYSALRLAKGIVKSGEIIAMIDTEKGRGRMYADEFEYLYEQIDPPFRPEKYQEAMQAAVNQGAKCIIVDSMSHEWEGIGGLLEWAGDIAEDMANRHGGGPDKYSFASWKKPKVAHQKLVQFMINYEIHVILCFRAKEKMGLRPGRNGKQEVVNLGWTPITDKDSLPYEATFIAVLTADQVGVPTFSYKALSHKLTHVFPEGRQLCEEHGKLLREWADKGEQATGGSQAQQQEQPDYVEQARAEARKGRDAFMAFWNGPGKTNGIRAACKPYLAELQRLSEEADSAAVVDEDPFQGGAPDEDPFGDNADTAPEPSEASQSDVGAETPETPAEAEAPTGGDGTEVSEASMPDAPIFGNDVGILDETGSEVDRHETANNWYFKLRNMLKESKDIGALLTNNTAGHLHWQASTADPSHKKAGANMWATFEKKASEGQAAA